MSDSLIHLIINPTSGRGGRHKLLPDLLAGLRGQGFEVVEYTTTAAGDGKRRAQEVAGRARAVLAFGGDGTANEVANGLAGSDTPLLIVPAGTENLLAKELKLPTTADGIISMLSRDRRVASDIGLANGMSFHSILGVGFDAEVVERVTQARDGHISHLTYFTPILKTFLGHKFPVVHVTADGESVFDGQAMVFVGNISRYATGLRICKRAQSDDGLLDLVVYPCTGRWSLMRHAFRTLLRTHTTKGGVIYRQAAHITIDTDQPQCCELDGDVGPELPLTVTISPHKINLILP